MDNASYRSLPSVDRVLRSPELTGLRWQYSRTALLFAVRDALAAARHSIEAGERPPAMEAVVERVKATAAAWEPATPLINATGVIIHTNLGRAPLSGEAVSAITEAAAYSDLEYDRASAVRASRQTRVREQLRALTGAESALVVGNNAAAVLLALAGLARGRDVLVSRGQAVEIGGGFRVPTILRQSGARLVEVGTTNRTRLADFAEAITPRTGALLHVHASNFRVVGFTEGVSLLELASLAASAGVPLIVDNGSGALLDTAQFGLATEPTVPDAVAAGADIVTFSGDKLLGGPQAGVIVGRAAHMARLAAHPLARALRPDKLILAALGATLAAYVRGDAVATLPVWQMIAARPEEIRTRAERWQSRAAAAGLSVEVVAGESTIGGGSLPGETLPTTLIKLPAGMTRAALGEAHPQPVAARLQGRRVLLDLRTVPPEFDGALLDAVLGLAPSGTMVDSAAE